jgi:Rab GDP dissociation inhibitor
MEDTYDVVVCGTGLVECILSGLLSQDGKKVLHIDRNPFYGGEGASLNITNLWKQFRPGQEPPQALGQNRDWNIDLIPKFIMSNGKLVKLLLKTRVSRYLEWKSIDGTYVYQMKESGLFSSGGAKISKVPANDKEAIKSDLMGLFEKRRCKNFFQFIQKYNPNDPKTWEKMDVRKVPFSDLIKHFELEPNTIDFIGHAVALYTNDDFYKRPAIETIDRILLYMDSHGRYGDSPFIYPVYGLGGIPEGFSRMCAISGGTFMLNTDIDEIMFDEAGKVSGVRNGDKIAKCSLVVMDPTYVQKTKLDKKLVRVGKLIRCICILTHPIPNTADVPSVQVIIPQRQTNRKSDIFILMVSALHNVCKQGYYIAIISTNVETNNPEAELTAAFDIMGPIKEKFITISDMWAPNPQVDPAKDGVYISSSMQPQSHFEGETENVLQLYKQITGKDIDLVNLPEDTEEQ